MLVAKEVVLDYILVDYSLINLSGATEGTDVSILGDRPSAFLETGNMFEIFHWLGKDF